MWVKNGWKNYNNKCFWFKSQTKVSRAQVKAKSERAGRRIERLIKLSALSPAYREPWGKPSPGEKAKYTNNTLVVSGLRRHIINTGVITRRGQSTPVSTVITPTQRKILCQSIKKYIYSNARVSQNKARYIQANSRCFLNGNYFC